MKLLFKNARIINPEMDEDFIGDLLTQGEIIEKIAENIEDSSAQIIDCTGLVLAPGLVDMHVHLRDPGLTYKEDIISGCEAAVSGGVTSLLCMPNTKPAIDNVDTVEYILNKAKNAAAKVYVTAAISADLSGDNMTDIKALKNAGAIALSDDGRPVEDSKMLLDALRLSKDLGMLTVSHCEDLYLAKNTHMNKGKVSDEIGVDGVLNAAEDCATARDIALATSENLPIHICHVSTKGSARLVRDAKANGFKVSAETAPHYFILTDEKLRDKDADYRMNPPLRVEEDRKAIFDAVVDGTIEVIATDHAPHSADEKADFFTAPNGVVGMQTSLAATLTAFDGVLSIGEIIKRMSTNPAKLLKIDAGKLLVGGSADIVVFDPNEEWVVEPEKFKGKSKNAVLKGAKLKGKVKYTIVNGDVKYIDKPHIV